MRSRDAVDVTALKAAESARAGQTLGRAFGTDPLWNAIIRDRDRRPELLERMFTVLAKAVVVQGLPERTPGFEGVGLWLRPGRDLSGWAMVRSGLGLARFVWELPRPDRKLMMTVLGQLDEQRKLRMPRPHWYVSAIGVDPEFQGLGMGSALMLHGIDRAERDGVPVYLETQTEANVEFYRHLGFEVVGECATSALPVPIWFMVRVAASA